MKINIGCGQAKFADYTNIDIDPGMKPDLVLDVSKQVLPFGSWMVDEVTMIHTIEHIARGFHPMVFGEINRVLKIGGELILAFPNAEKILQFALDNHRGMRQSYWEYAIVGRGLSIWDCHRALIFPTDMISFLREYGFGSFQSGAEVDQEHNLFLKCKKLFSVVERSQLIVKEVCNA